MRSSVQSLSSSNGNLSLVTCINQSFTKCTRVRVGVPLAGDVVTGVSKQIVIFNFHHRVTENHWLGVKRLQLQRLHSSNFGLRSDCNKGNKNCTRGRPTQRRHALPTFSRVDMPCTSSFAPVSAAGRNFLEVRMADSPAPHLLLDSCTRMEQRRRHPRHSFTQQYQGRNSAPSHISFVCCLTVATHSKPKVHAACGTSHVNRSWSAGTLTLEADSPANLIDLTCPHLLNFLQHRWIASRLQRMSCRPFSPL